jgi:hypothetical protein
MFFLPLLAVPAILETLGTVALVTVAARVVNDAYDAMKGDKDESDK